MSDVKTILKKAKRKSKDMVLLPGRKIKTYQIRKNKDFSIICNNCWAGFVYQDYGLQYTSPTIGIYFYAEDYIKFLKDIKKYINMKLKFIKVTESKYYDYMVKNNLDLFMPIGVLDDIELIFLHYKDEEEAFMKWEKRKKRINWDKLIVKFNDQNLCTEELIREFDSLDFENKLCFTSKAYDGLDSVIQFKEFEGKPFVPDDIHKKIYRRYINTTNYINNMGVGNGRNSR
ncbi:MAG: DUF1919 domain-containing protein [Clostridia bacterium]|jgi:uncharacterized protein (DUF1919 family)